jgi:DnaK suppressor protein
MKAEQRGVAPDNQGITRTNEGDSTEQSRLHGTGQSRANADPARSPDVKPQSKATAKAKPAAKSAKSPVKAAAKKPAGKPVAKPAVKKAVPAKKAAPLKKAAPPKKAVPAKKSAAKPAGKPAAKAGKVAPKQTPARKTPTSSAKAPAAKTKAAPGKADKQTSKPKLAAAGQVPPGSRAMPPRPDAATVSASPARAAKPSARLAQITVPSMAQSVASTAAKASYTQTMAPSVLTPPPLVAVKKDPKLANNWKTRTAQQLSDAEVMAMPDSEYMNEKQLAFFRLKLSQLKQDILNSAGETTEHLREDTVIVPDPADRATIEEEHALELRTRDRERKLLKKIEQSIGRIDAGDYGYCDETGEPIGVGRLLARPTATLSLEAQQRRELKQKMFGD